MRRLDRSHLSLLAALDRLGSLSAAAADLGITQSAASQRLREAERRLGVPLVTRAGKGMHLNRAGARLSESGALMDRVLIRAEAEAQWLGRNEGARVRVATGFYDMPGWFVRVQAAFSTSESDTVVEWLRCRDRDITALLAAGEADAAFLPNPDVPPGFGAVPIFEDTLTAVVASGDPLARKDALTAADFVSRRYLAAGYVPQAGFEFERVFRPANRYPTQVVQIESATAILAMIAVGQGVSILPAFVLDESDGKTALRCIPLSDGPFPVTWKLVVRPRARPDLAETLAAALRDCVIPGPRSLNSR